MIRAGVTGERDAAYEIEFHLGSPIGMTSCGSSMMPARAWAPARACGEDSARFPRCCSSATGPSRSRQPPLLEPHSRDPRQEAAHGPNGQVSIRPPLPGAAGHDGALVWSTPAGPPGLRRRPPTTSASRTRPSSTIRRTPGARWTRRRRRSSCGSWPSLPEPKGGAPADESWVCPTAPEPPRLSSVG
jgi:hypothetical protein